MPFLAYVPHSKALLKGLHFISEHVCKISLALVPIGNSCLLSRALGLHGVQGLILLRKSPVKRNSIIYNFLLFF